MTHNTTMFTIGDELPATSKFKFKLAYFGVTFFVLNFAVPVIGQAIFMILQNPLDAVVVRLW